MIGLVGVVVVAVAVVGGVILFGGSAAPINRFDGRGKIVLSGGFTSYYRMCNATTDSGLYDTVRQGAPIQIGVVGNHNEDVDGTIGGGLVQGATCVFTFEVDGLPAGGDSYFLRIPGQDALDASESDLRTGRAEVDFGPG